VNDKDPGVIQAFIKFDETFEDPFSCSRLELVTLLCRDCMHLKLHVKHLSVMHGNVRQNFRVFEILRITHFQSIAQPFPILPFRPFFGVAKFFSNLLDRFLAMYACTLKVNPHETSHQLHKVMVAYGHVLEQNFVVIPQSWICFQDEDRFQFHHSMKKLDAR